MRSRWIALRTLLLAVACLAVAGQVSAQDAVAKAPAYDVVSIKPNNAGAGSTRVSITAERFYATNVSLRNLMVIAYNLKTQEQIVGLSGAAASARFDVEGKLDAEGIAAFKGLSDDDNQARRRLLMQALLADRFQLKVHHETKEMQEFELVAAKGGFKLKSADPEDAYANGMKAQDGSPRGKGSMNTTNGSLTSQGTSMSNLVSFLAQQMHRPVVDRTGLNGSYDFSLRWMPEDGPAPMVNGQPVDLPALPTALEEQLGLKLVAIKGPVDTIVVDHVELPSEN